MSKDYFIIPIFVPHLGCPHDCVFCNQRKITGLSTNVTPEDVKYIIEEHLATFPSREIIIEVAFYGGSFTGIDKDIQRELLSVPLKYKDEGIIHGIRLSTRPDYIDMEILDLLKGYGVDTIELGVQSLKDEVLYKSGRGHNSQQVHEASNLIKEYGFNLGLQMMVGLVGDNRSKSIFTAKEIVKLNPYCVRIYPTLVIKDTLLEKMYKDGVYKPLSIEEAVSITTELLMIFEHYDINVIRTGLQPTDNIRLGKDVVAGPFHPSFRQLVEANIYKIILSDYINTYDKSIIKGKTMTIESNSKNISNIAGQRSCNIEYLIHKYKLKKIKIYQKKVPREMIKISIDNNFDTINRKEVISKYLKSKAII